MKRSRFEEWLSTLKLLSEEQRRLLLRELGVDELHDPHAGSVEKFVSQPAANEIVDEKSADTSIGAGSRASGDEGLDFVGEIGRERILRSGCPHCGTSEVRPWGKAGGLPRYRCTVCRKTFSAFTATPMAGLRHKDRWLDHARSLIEGETLAQAAERCQVDRSTAYRWRRRFLAARNSEEPKSFSGIVEADVSLIPESFKGRKRGLPRPARKRGNKANEHDALTEQIPVVVARDRRGATFDAVLPSLDEASLGEALRDLIPPATDFCCDGGKEIQAFAKRAKLKVHVAPARDAGKPDDPQFHIDNVRAYQARRKEWLRRFHGVSTENLPMYLRWYRLLETAPDRPSAATLISAAAGLGPQEDERQ
jgi:transposase-like protein